MRLTFRIRWILSGLCLMALAACESLNEEDLFGADPVCEVQSVSYTQDVLPILQSRCLGCHASGIAQGNVVLEGIGNLTQVAASGRLVGAISHSPGYSAMPKNENKLSDCQILTIQTWVEDGTPNN